MSVSSCCALANSSSRLAALVVLAASWMYLSPTAAADERANPDRIAALVKQLGSEDFAEREAASDELTGAGLPAFAALEAAALHPDREVRYRSVRILGQIRELDLQRRLEAFLSGKEDSGDYPLPAWSRFKNAYGDDATSRQLFVDMTRADPEVMRSLESSPKAAGDQLADRAFQYQQAMQLGQQQQLSLAQVGVILFVAAEEDVALAAQTMSMIYSYCYQPTLRDAVTSSSRNGIPRKMVGAIVRRSDDMAAYQGMLIALNLGLDDGMVPSLKILKTPGNRAPHFSQYALMTVAKLGNQSHVPLVEKLLEDKSVVTRMQENKVIYDVQVRDAALATAVILTKQQLKDYFGERPNHQLTDPQQIFFNPRVIGFTDDQKRAETHKKWAEYKAKQPAPAGGEPAKPGEPTKQSEPAKQGEATPPPPQGEKPAPNAPR
ncbi:MAG: hypothetical protein L0211_05265 [Planctomycetaceae bacterium]|nr:hypothetical protein [Planctomycetaceae bacterium]